MTPFSIKIIFDGNSNLLNKYTLNTLFNYKNSEGNLYIDMYNEKLAIIQTLIVLQNSKLSKYLINSILSFEALVTNSVSTTRSVNDESSTLRIFL